MADSSAPSSDTVAPSGSALSSKDDAALYTKAQRWRTYLEQQSAAFRRLQDERARGWQSAAMDEWYAKRQSQCDASPSLTHNTTGSNASTGAPSASATAVPSGVTSFVEADIVTLAERYRQHARRVTHEAAPSFFVSAVPATAQVSPPLFLDLGCAPGGVSKYLLEDLHWRGVGVSLASTNGGIDVDPILVDESVHGENYVLLDGDVTQSPSSWCRSAAYAHVAAEKACAEPFTENHINRQHHTSSSADTVAAFAAKLFTVDTPLPQPIFHFVNGGAVLDHGQRQRWDKADEGAAAAAKDAAGAALDGTRGRLSMPLLPWFSLLVPQLQAALSYVAEGGAVLLVHGAPHCASLFILLRCMDDIFGVPSAEETLAPSTHACQTHVLETMHLAKPPVYLLWTNVHRQRCDSDKQAARSELEKYLLQSLDPNKPRISPLTADASSSTTPSPETFSPPDLLRAKQAFWLGESDEGFNLAQEGFAKYGTLVDGIWSRVAAFLRRRRERAEREVAVATNRRLGVRGNGQRRGGGGPGKRTRSEGM